jgi:hypothetical protein
MSLSRSSDDYWMVKMMQKMEKSYEREKNI